MLPAHRGWPLLNPGLPPPNGLPVGYVLSPGGRRLGLMRIPSDTGHVAVVGATGSGKSNTLKALALALASTGSTVILLDWEGEHGDVADATLEPWEVRAPILAQPNPHTVVETIEAALQTLGERYQLTPLMSLLLAKTLSTTRRRIESILEALEEKAERERREDIRNSIYALIRRLWPLQQPLKALEPNTSKRLDLTAPKPSTIYAINLSSLPPQQRTLYTQLLAAYINLNRKPAAKPTIYLAVEDAHNTAKPGTPLEQLLLEARKKNIRLILVTSHPTPILHNTSTIIAHRQPDTTSAKKIADLLAPPKQAKEELTALLLNLPKGQAIVKLATTNPILAKICEAPSECRELIENPNIL